MPTFGELLTAYMTRTGIGDAELARRVGVSRLTLVRWKEGVTSRPRHREDVVRCAELLRLVPEERDQLLLAAGFSPENSSDRLESPPPADSASASSVEPDRTVPSPFHRRKRYRVAGAAAVVLVAALVAGALAVQLLDAPAYPSAGKDESLIVIAPFVNYTAGQQGYNVRGRLKSELDREILSAGLVGVRTVVWPKELGAEEEAAAEGRRSNATIVIWGEYDSGRVMAVITIARGQSEPHDQQVVDLGSSPSELPATINIELTEEVRYVALLTLGQLYLERGAFDRAKSVLIQAMARPPAEQDALASLQFRLGRAYQGGELADLDEAIRLFSQVLGILPESVDAYNSRAVAYLDRGRAGDTDRAFDDLIQALTIRPEHAATYLNRAVAYMERGRDGDLHRAVADLTQAITLRPDYADAYVNRAGVYLDRGALGDLDRAFEDLSQAMAISPGFSAAYLNRGNAYLDRGQEGDLLLAVKQFTRAIDLAPSSPMAYFNRGLVYSALEDLDRSIADLLRAQELRPRELSFNNTLCWQLAVTREPEKALPYCKLAMADDPAGLTRDSRGLVYAVMGRTDEAIADFEAFLVWVDRSPKETCRNHYRTSRLAWIEQLEAGKSPFDGEALRGLRVRPSMSRGDPC